MTIVMSGLAIIMYFSMRQLLQDYVLTRLQNDAVSLIGGIQQGSDMRWRVLPGRMSGVYDRVKSGNYYQVEIDDQVISSRSLFDAEFPLKNNNSDLSGHYLRSGPGLENWLVWFQRVNKNSQQINIRIAEDIEPIQKQLLHYTVFALLLVLMVTAILIYLQHRTLSKSFYIFEWLRQTLPSVRPREITESGMHVPREIVPLLDEIEKLVEQLSNRIERTRHAIGNLSHEIKRPLQLLSLQQENEGGADLSEPIEEIKKILERELKRAKISGSPRTAGAFNLEQESQVMIRILEKIYPHIEIEFNGQKQIETPGLDRDDMLELIGNLLDNACKFASTKAKLEIKASADLLTLIFDDDGAGLELEQMEQMKRRGVRLDENVAGHGLGLGISGDILESYRGTMTFSRSSMGGLSVQVLITLH